MRLQWSIALAMAVAAAAARAQDPPPPPLPPETPLSDAARPRGEGAGPRHESRALLEQIMVARISQELSLSDEDTVLLVRRFSETREEVRALMRERAAQMRALGEMLRANADAAALDTALEAVRALDRKVFEARQTAMDELGADLTPWQRARLYVFLGNFENDLRRLVQQARERARRGEPPLDPNRPRRPPRPGDTPPPEAPETPDPAAASAG